MEQLTATTVWTVGLALLVAMALPQLFLLESVRVQGPQEAYFHNSVSGLYVLAVCEPGYSCLSKDGTILARWSLEKYDSIAIDGSDGDDYLLIDFENGNPIPSGFGILWNGRSQSTDQGDAVELRNYHVKTVVSALHGPDSGIFTLIDFDNRKFRVSYEGLEPIYMTGNSDNIFFDMENLVMSAFAATLNYNGTYLILKDDSPSFEDQYFLMPNINLHISNGPSNIGSVRLNSSLAGLQFPNLDVTFYSLNTIIIENFTLQVDSLTLSATAIKILGIVDAQSNVEIKDCAQFELHDGGIRTPQNVSIEVDWSMFSDENLISLMDCHFYVNESILIRADANLGPGSQTIVGIFGNQVIFSGMTSLDITGILIWDGIQTAVELIDCEIEAPFSIVEIRGEADEPPAAVILSTLLMDVPSGSITITGSLAGGSIESGCGVNMTSPNFQLADADLFITGDITGTSGSMNSGVYISGGIINAGSGNVHFQSTLSQVLGDGVILDSATPLNIIVGSGNFRINAAVSTGFGCSISGELQVGYGLLELNCDGVNFGNLGQTTNIMGNTTTTITSDAVIQTLYPDTTIRISEQATITANAAPAGIVGAGGSFQFAGGSNVRFNGICNLEGPFLVDKSDGKITFNGIVTFQNPVFANNSYDIDFLDTLHTGQLTIQNQGSLSIGGQATFTGTAVIQSTSVHLKQDCSFSDANSEITSPTIFTSGIIQITSSDPLIINGNIEPHPSSTGSNELMLDSIITNELSIGSVSAFSRIDITKLDAVDVEIYSGAITILDLSGGALSRSALFFSQASSCNNISIPNTRIRNMQGNANVFNLITASLGSGEIEVSDSIFQVSGDFDGDIRAVNSEIICSGCYFNNCDLYINPTSTLTPLPGPEIFFDGNLAIDGTLKTKSTSVATPDQSRLFIDTGSVVFSSQSSIINDPPFLLDKPNSPAYRVLHSNLGSASVTLPYDFIWDANNQVVTYFQISNVPGTNIDMFRFGLVLSIFAPPNVDEGTNITFNASLEDPNNAEFTAQHLVYRFDDGNDVIDSQSSTFVYAGVGGPDTVNMAVTVRDSLKDVDMLTATVQVQIDNVPPVVSINASPTTPFVGQDTTVEVDVSDIFDTAFTYSWSIGGITQQETTASITRQFLSDGAAVFAVSVSDGAASIVESVTVFVQPLFYFETTDFTCSEASICSPSLTLKQGEVTIDTTSYTIEWDLSSIGLGFNYGILLTLPPSNGDSVLQLPVSVTETSSGFVIVSEVIEITVENVPPVVTMIPSLLGPFPGQNTDVSASVVDAFDTTFTYEWAINGEATAYYSPMISLSFSDPGIKNVTVFVGDGSDFVRGEVILVVEEPLSINNTMFECSEASVCNLNIELLQSGFPLQDPSDYWVTWDLSSVGSNSYQGFDLVLPPLNGPQQIGIPISVIQDSTGFEVVSDVISIFVSNVPPTVSLSVSTQEPFVGQGVSAFASASDVFDTTFSYFWKVDDQILPVTTPSFVFQFHDTDNHNLTVTVTDNAHFDSDFLIIIPQELITFNETSFACNEGYICQLELVPMQNNEPVQDLEDYVVHWEVDGDVKEGYSISLPVQNGPLTITIPVVLKQVATGFVVQEDRVKVNIINIPPTVTVGGPYEVRSDSTIQLCGNSAVDVIDDLAFLWFVVEGNGYFPVQGREPVYKPIGDVEEEVIATVAVSDGFNLEYDNVTIFVVSSLSGIGDACGNVNPPPTPVESGDVGETEADGDDEGETETEVENEGEGEGEGVDEGQGGDEGDEGQGSPGMPIVGGEIVESPDTEPTIEQDFVDVGDIIEEEEVPCTPGVPCLIFGSEICVSSQEECERLQCIAYGCEDETPEEEGVVMNQQVVIPIVNVGEDQAPTTDIPVPQRLDIVGTRPIISFASQDVSGTILDLNVLLAVEADEEGINFDNRIVSEVYVLTLIDIFTREEVAEFSENVALQFVVDSSLDISQLSLQFFDEDAGVWRIADSMVTFVGWANEEQTLQIVQGFTNHFTSFAVLLSGNDGGESDLFSGEDLVIWILSVSFLAAAVLLSIVAIIAISKVPALRGRLLSADTHVRQIRSIRKEKQKVALSSREDYYD